MKQARDRGAYTPPTCALSELVPIGFEFDSGMWGRVRITAQITREEYLSDLEDRRRHDRDRGLPPARAGTYIPETREFIPSRETPADCKYFYRVEPAE